MLCFFSSSEGLTGLVVSVIATVRGSQSSSNLQRGPSLPALVSLRRSSDLSKVISQSFGPQGDLRRRGGSEWRWSKAEHRDPQLQSHVQSTAHAFSQVASYTRTQTHTDAHAHNPELSWSARLYRVPFELMPGGKA